MGPSIKNPGFGHKGANDHVKTLAESLLTGKPLARAPGRDRTPKLKPRDKPRFGRKDTPETERESERETVRAINVAAPSPGRRWAVWAAAVVVALAVQILVGLYAWRSPIQAVGAVGHSVAYSQSPASSAIETVAAASNRLWFRSA